MGFIFIWLFAFKTSLNNSVLDKNKLKPINMCKQVNIILKKRPSIAKHKNRISL